MFISLEHRSLSLLLSCFFCLIACGLIACGEVEELTAQSSLSPEDYEQVIEPLLLDLRCEDCHAEELGGFKFDISGTRESISDNFLYVQRSILLEQPDQSPLLQRLTPPNSGHPLYFCPQDCRYQKILLWISTPIGQPDYEGLECEEPIDNMSVPFNGQCL